MKPMIIKLKESKASIMESVNASLNNGIPCYLLEPIIAEVLSQIRIGAQAEYERALKQAAEDESKMQHAKQEKKGADPE